MQARDNNDSDWSGVSKAGDRKMNSACISERKPIECNIHTNQRKKLKGEDCQGHVRLGNTRCDNVC